MSEYPENESPAERRARRHAKVAAALAAVSPCPAEWTGEDGSPHLCFLLGAPGHRHMCSCGAVAPETPASESKGGE